MTDESKSSRAVRRRRTTRRLNRRPVRVPEDRFARPLQAPRSPDEDLDEHLDAEDPESWVVDDAPADVGEEAGAGFEITEEMALLAGRLTSPDAFGEAAAADDDSPAVVVSPPMRVIEDRPGARREPASETEEQEGDGEGEAEGQEAAEPADEMTLEDGDVEESLELDQPTPPSRTRTPPPPPPAPVRKRPPPPPANAQGTARRLRQRNIGWWETLFSEEYLQTYVPPTPEQVARQCDFYWQQLGLQRGHTVLDVGCGLGLHAIELTRRGCLVVGIDLSLPMITRAAEEAQQQNLRINFLHTDIRDIEFEGTFDAVLCVGTTFGFFDDKENADVLRRMYAALRPSGKLLLDVTNRDYVLSSQPNLVWFQGDGCLCMEESEFNYFTSQLLMKRTLMQDDGRQTEVGYSLRLYSLHELGQLLRHVGFRVEEVSGQEATRGVFFGCHSMRIMVLANRQDPGDERAR